jgi:hypothetical protein
MQKRGVKMTVLAKDVFTTAMNLMEEESEDGTFEGYPTEYKKKAWSILTILQAELLSPSVTPLVVTGESNVLQVDDRSAITILPYGVAAHLLMSEDQGKAAFFNARYDELKRKRPAIITKIKDVYGIVEQEDLDQTSTSL